jgi:iron complex outermembrane recepter protein
MNDAAAEGSGCSLMSPGLCLADAEARLRVPAPPPESFRLAMRGWAVVSRLPNRLLWTALLLSVASVLHAARPETTLAPITVMATRAAPNAGRAALSSSFIDRSEIAGSGAANLTELLARETGIMPRSLFGNGRFAGIDLRGQGDTQSSNVLVLVDGVRLNFDQAGPDLSSVALAAIDSIEVLRGAQGVRFGDGAVGGVINIITRRGREAAARADLRLRVGSHGQQRTDASFGIGNDAVGAAFDVARTRDAGYRANNELESDLAQASFNWRPASELNLYARLQGQQDEYGLPGPVSREAFATESGRQSASDPLGGGHTREMRWQLGFDYQPRSWWNWSGGYSERLRDNPSVINPEPDIALADQQSRIEIEARQAMLASALSWQGQDYGLELDLGVDWRSGDAISQRNGVAVRDQSTRKYLQQETLSGHVRTSLRLGQHWSVSLGGRDETTETDIVESRYRQRCSRLSDTVLPPQLIEVPIVIEIAPGVFINAGTTSVSVPGETIPGAVVCAPFAYEPGEAVSRRWRNQAGELALHWVPLNGLEFYARRADSFRTPNVDDLALATVDLAPQSATEWEVGLRWQPDARLRLGLNGFSSRTESEIYFDNSINRNYQDDIDRRGGELELAWQPLAQWLLRLNAAHVHARFAPGGGRVPLVPELSAFGSLTFEYQSGKRIEFTSRYAASRLDGAELAGTDLPQVPEFHVESLQWSWQAGRWDLQAGISNLLDVAVADSVYGQSYYPLPGREWFAELSLQLP